MQKHCCVKYPKPILKSTKNDLYNLDFIVEKYSDLDNLNQYMSQKQFLAEIFLMFCFDALIGNGDRHDRNLGFLWNNDNKKYEFAPLFDNGSCLSREISENNTGKKDIQRYLDNKISFDPLIIGAKARHDMLFAPPGKNSHLNYYQFIKKFIQKYKIDKQFLNQSNIKTIIDKILNEDINNFLNNLHPVEHIGKFSLTSLRIKFINAIIKKRLCFLKDVLKEIKNE